VKKVDNLLGTGGRLSIVLSKKGNGELYKLKVKASNQELPLATSSDLQMSIDMETFAVSSTRTFESKGLSTPIFQRLRYNGD
jgi:hypothetical protein